MLKTSFLVEGEDEGHLYCFEHLLEHDTIFKNLYIPAFPPLSDSTFPPVSLQKKLPTVFGPDSTLQWFLSHYTQRPTRQVVDWFEHHKLVYQERWEFQSDDVYDEVQEDTNLRDNRKLVEVDISDLCKYSMAFTIADSTIKHSGSGVFMEAGVMVPQDSFLGVYAGKIVPSSSYDSVYGLRCGTLCRW